MQHLPQSVADAPVIETADGYDYILLPISNGVPTLSPALLREVVVGFTRVADLDVDKILTPEAMGIHVSTALSLVTDLPLVVVRGREYGLPGEVAVHEATGHDEERYLNDVRDGDRVLLVDDLLATGRTLADVAAAVEQTGAAVADVVVVARRVGVETTADLAHDVTALMDVEVRDGEAVVVDQYDAD